MPRSSTTPLYIKEFRHLWLASIVSNLGSFLGAVAAAWLMLELTGSPLWVGLMVAAPTLPTLLFAMPAGAMADLLDRRRIMLVSHGLMAVSASSMAILEGIGSLGPATLLGFGLLMGLGLAFNLPAWNAMLPDLVPNAHVASAVSLNSAAFNVARAIGPAIGGVLVATVGAAPAFALNAVSYLAVIAAVAAFPRSAIEERADSIMSAIGSGLRYARFTPSYRWLLLVTALFALSSSVVQSVLPTFTETLGGGAATYGLLLGAMGVGALVGAFSRPAAAERLGARMVPASIAAFGVTGVGLGLSPTPLVAVAAMAVTGVLWVWILSTLNATAQLLSPAWVRGRIMSLYTLAFLGFLPLGSIASGALADLIGASAAIVALSVGSVALGAAAFRLPLPVLADVVTPQPAATVEPPSHILGVEGGPVMVVNTWVIDAQELDEFLHVMEELRRVRLRTGAYRWRLYRNVGDAHRMTEVFLLTSWQQHLRQHHRIDTAAAEAIQRARAFDRDGGPVTHHLAAIDVTSDAVPAWDELVAHEALHASDGSVPLPVPQADQRVDDNRQQVRAIVHSAPEGGR